MEERELGVSTCVIRQGIQVDEKRHEAPRGDNLLDRVVFTYVFFLKKNNLQLKGVKGLDRALFPQSSHGVVCLELFF
jgi:hypothetical protein